MNQTGMAPSGKPPFRRRKFLIHKPAQLRLMSALAGVALVVNIVSLTALYFFLRLSMEGAMFTSHMKLKSLGELMTPVIFRVNAFSTAAMMMICAVVIMYAVHKMNLALRILRRCMGRIGSLDFTCEDEGEPGEAVKNTLLAFTDMRLSLNESFGELSSAAARLEKLSAEKPDITAMKGDLGRIREVLSRFG